MAILVHHAKAPIPKLQERLAALQPIIDSLMAKEPADRPASAADAARLIDAKIAELTRPDAPRVDASGTVPMPVVVAEPAVP
jgi:hypothetical protein